MRAFAEISKEPKVRVVNAGPDGMAAVVTTSLGRKVRVIASVGGDWDHVSVSHASRLPTYHEMKIVKRLFFAFDEWAIEYHPAASDYISINDNVLHLWRPQNAVIPKPPEFMV